MDRCEECKGFIWPWHNWTFLGLKTGNSYYVFWRGRLRGTWHSTCIRAAEKERSK